MKIIAATRISLSPVRLEDLEALVAIVSRRCAKASNVSVASILSEHDNASPTTSLQTALATSPSTATESDSSLSNLEQGGVSESEWDLYYLRAPKLSAEDRAAET